MFLSILITVCIFFISDRIKIDCVKSTLHSVKIKDINIKKP